MTDKRIPAAAIRRAWARTDLTVAEAAATVGLSRPAFWRRAKALGLERRKDGLRLPVLPPDFDRMWRAGVRAAEIADLIGRAPSCVSRCARLRGLPRRQHHDQYERITLAAWRVAQVDRRHGVTGVTCATIRSDLGPAATPGEGP